MSCCGSPRPDIGKISELADRAEFIASTGAAQELVGGMTRLLDAMIRWKDTGFSTVDQNGFDARYAVCLSCQLWDDKARLGFGKCNHEKCGCTKAKLWLSSEKCPDGKWL